MFLTVYEIIKPICYRTRKINAISAGSEKRNDKSKWLAQAGYTLENWRELENDLRVQILPLEAIATENTSYGQVYEIRGDLTGPAGKTLPVVTVWISEIASRTTKFITMYPDKGSKR